MKKQTVIALALFVLLTTIIPQEKIVISKFNLKKIYIVNNQLIKEDEIKKLLKPIYGRNLIFLSNLEIKQELEKNSFIESFKIKKKFPDTLKIEIFEKKPIAILFFKKKKYYLSERIDLIQFKSLKNYENLPLVFGEKDKFKIFYKSLMQIDFPLKIIKTFTFYESNRWDLETINKTIIKLPSKNYNKSLENYLSLRNKKKFKMYKVFDYRLNDQLILK